jgi:hypothetical protein
VQDVQNLDFRLPDAIGDQEMGSDDDQLACARDADKASPGERLLIAPGPSPPDSL